MSYKQTFFQDFELHRDLRRSFSNKSPSSMRNLIHNITFFTIRYVLLGKFNGLSCFRIPQKNSFMFSRYEKEINSRKTIIVFFNLKILYVK